MFVYCLEVYLDYRQLRVYRLLKIPQDIRKALTDAIPTVGADVIEAVLSEDTFKKTQLYGIDRR